MNLNTILNLLATYRITTDELMLIYLTFMAQDEEGHPEYLAKWIANSPEGTLKKCFESLKAKNIIHKDYNPSSYKPNEIEFNKIFLKTWLKNSGEMGQELFNAYPNMILIKGKYFSLKNIGKKFNTLDDFYFHYSATIGHNPELHKEVMELLEWGKAHGKINYNICEFVASQKWGELKYLRDNGEVADGETVSTFDMYEDE